ncbi:MAG: glutamate decarboxylase [Desulfovibrionaceae bacterium]|nr:glutamate decarboxylase [Desulfovibrionaceae bacterium]
MNNQNLNYAAPIFGSDAEAQILPQEYLNDSPIEPRLAYQLIKDELLDEGNARQNLATFCQTYMEPEATQIMSETLEKNAIDKSEYPRTTELENSCVRILAHLWNVPDSCKFIGTSTVGSSEACMLGGLAMKFRWRTRAQQAGIDTNAKKPNLVISSGYQVCWEKFCVYWDIELREVPMDEQHKSLDPAQITKYIDDYTIGVVGILGITYTGMLDDIKGLDAVLEEYNKKAKVSVPIHVDGASGGMFCPFLDPQLVWDFRLKNVVSISTSGHKYGLVYPGIGWVIWKDEEFLPKELIFSVSYLGGELPTIAINFSRSASQIIGQYYNFLRFGFDGYKAIHQRTRDVAQFLAKGVEDTGYFEVINKAEVLPIVCYKLKESPTRKWQLNDLTDRLLMKGWQVPTYPLPKNLEHVMLQRYVCRADFGMQMAHNFLQDFTMAIKELDEANISFYPSQTKEGRGFNHSK